MKEQREKAKEFLKSIEILDSHLYTINGNSKYLSEVLTNFAQSLQEESIVSDEEKEVFFVQKHLLEIYRTQSFYFLNDLMYLLNTEHINTDFINEARNKLSKEIIRLCNDIPKLQTNVEGCNTGGQILFLNELKEFINCGMSKNDLKTMINQRLNEITNLPKENK